jgi:hypothetical protein
MSVGNAQRYEIRMNDLPSFKMYHYETGGSVDKTIWSDAAKTTPLAQPAVADANGNLTFFADGLYRMVFKDSTDVSISGMDYDDFKITADMATVFEANQGTALPSATAAKIGHHFLLFDVSDNILGIYYCDGTQYKAAVAFTAAGDQIFESVLTNGMPVYNIQHADYGAVPGEAADQTARIQLAVTDATDAGGGIVYCPQGEYQVDGSLDVNNSNIVFKGDGKGQTIFKQTANPSAAMIDYDTNDVSHRLVIKGMSLTTTVVGTDTCIDTTWPSTAGELDYPNLLIDDVEIAPARASSATAYFTDYIKISDGKKARITNSFLRGTDNGSTNGTGITTSGDTRFLEIDHCEIHYLNKPIYLTGDTEHVDITNNRLNVAEIGVDIDVNAGMEGFNISDNKFIDMQTNGIKNQGANVIADITMDNNRISKDVDSTNDFRGIVGDFNVYTIRGNIIRDDGSASGTDYAIEVDSSLDGNISDNIMQNLDKGIVLTANSSDSVVTDNYMDNTNPVVDDSGTNNILYDNQNSGVAAGGISTEVETITTTDASVTTIWNKTLATNTVYHITVDVVARRTAGGGEERAVYRRIACVYRIAGVAVLEGTVATPATIESLAAWDTTVSVTSNDAIVTVTGAAAQTVDWKAFVTVMPLG